MPPESSNDAYEPVGPGVAPAALPAESTSDAKAASHALAVKSGKFPFNLIGQLDLALAQTGRAFVLMSAGPNPYALAVGSRALNRIIQQIALEQGRALRKAEIAEVNEVLRAYAELANRHVDIWYRVAPCESGVEIDLGDDSHTRVRVTAAGVEVLARGSSTLFYRLPHTRPMVMPAKEGNLALLRPYLNIDDVSVTLFLGWLTYTLAHAKQPTTSFPILVLQGDQGSGKTFLSTLIQRLVDPNVVGIRILPTHAKDLAIAAENAHVVAFDNVRGFNANMADLLCIAATGGSLSTRQLYTDDTEHVQRLHVAVVLNGIHSFLNQPDLAQRSLPIRLLSIKAAARKSETDLASQFEADLPAIIRGLFDRIAVIFRHLPDAEVTSPERMIDFSRWLAATELADGVPPGVYQGAYSSVLADAQLDTLLDNPLAAAIIEFAEGLKDGKWSGTPTQLFDQLNFATPVATTRSKYWPSTPIAMSKRLLPLEAGLRQQGVDVQLGRGKERRITITRVEVDRRD